MVQVTSGKVFEAGLVSTLKVQVSALSAICDKNLAKERCIRRFMKAASRLKPKRSNFHPGIYIVLEGLTKSPFEPLLESNIKTVSWKTVFLIAIASARWISDHPPSARTQSPQEEVFHTIDGSPFGIHQNSEPWRKDRNLDFHFHGVNREILIQAGLKMPFVRRNRIQEKPLLLSPFQSPLCTHELTDAEKVFAECQQDQPVPFSQCLTQDELSHCQKVGEGVYGEVFRTLRGGQHVALKVIPIEGSQKVNGENQKSFAEILPEIIISKELSLLNEGEDNQTGGFIQLHSAHTVQGSYPPELLSAWDRFSEEKGTENERPDLFGSEQLFMILEFEFGGDDLERISSKLPSVAASRSILHQVTAALAVAEAELRFEHRDLHWGNLLIEKNTSCTLSVSLHGEMIDIPSARIQVKIIDYTLSRLDKDGLTVFCDLSTDEELFLGEGDLQFDVYRSMRQENQNVWSSYKPHSNVLWLHYLCDKLLSEVRYIKKPTSAPQRRVLSRLQDFRREVLQFGSATEVLKRSRLFK
ncbi:serine/threonine-protein kinase haspin-like [Rhinoderma darwinii]|uniref:serine/threonine-protein kinase haspin-like n=1 Tax=Rhinoderma darwinii TaxID=43563 RepID=UPI003F6714A7